MKTIKKGILTIGILVAIISLGSHNLFANGKETRNAPEVLTNSFVVAEQEALEAMNLMDKIQNISLENENVVKVIDAQESVIFSGQVKTRESKKLILKSNFLMEVNGTRYYQLINK